MKKYIYNRKKMLIKSAIRTQTLLFRFQRVSALINSFGTILYHSLILNICTLITDWGINNFQLDDSFETIVFLACMIGGLFSFRNKKMFTLRSIYCKHCLLTRLLFISD